MKKKITKKRITLTKNQLSKCRGGDQGDNGEIIVPNKGID